MFPPRGLAGAPAYTGEVLLLQCALLAQLPDDFLTQARGFAEHVVQSIEHLSELVRTDWAFVSHGFRTDYRPDVESVKLCQPRSARSCDVRLRPPATCPLSPAP